MNVNDDGLVTTVSFQLGDTTLILDVEDVATALVRMLGDSSERVVEAGGVVFHNAGFGITASHPGGDTRIEYDKARRIVDEYSYQTLD